MTSRLDRLFVLLESGSSPVTRRVAARQLGEVQRLHPHELHNLLGRIINYLHSPNWETRIAAGHAVESVISSVPEWDPPGACKKENCAETSATLSQTGRLSFDKFDMGRVMANSAHLLGSEGKEYELDDVLTGMDIKERMAHQRQQLNVRLGLDVMAALGVDTSHIVSVEDLTTGHASTVKTEEKKSIGEMLQQSGLCSQDSNRACRKSRLGSKQHSRNSLDDCGEPESKRIKTEGAIAIAVKPEDMTPTAVALGGSVPDGTGSWGDAIDWPFESFSDQLCQDLFSTSWEIRHGAATAFRELVKIHGGGGGKQANVTKLEMEALHQSWLEDVALRLLCVLALDRFGDFVTDQVTAPVRETCAQALGMVLRLMSPGHVNSTLKVLLQLTKEKEWEARHGGLLGLKYLLAVREDLVGELLPIAYPHIVEGLADPVDDVGAVAASALIPVAETISTLLGSHVDSTIQKLWDLLLEQDELAAACNSFMGLLAALLNTPKCRQLLSPQPLSVVVPRLWPFLSHNTSSVRRATLQTLRTLTGSQSVDWTQELLQAALRHVFQMVLLEPCLSIQLLAEQVWCNLLCNSTLAQLLVAACPYVTTWLCLAMQPAKVAFDSNMLIQTVRERDPEKSVRKVKAFAPLDSNCGGPVPKLFIGGAQSAPSSSHDPNVIQARMICSRMLGLLSCYLVQKAPGITYTPDIESPIDCYTRVLLVHLNSKSALQRMVAGLVLSEWGKHSFGPKHLSENSHVPPRTNGCPTSIAACLHTCLTESIYFDEIAHAYTRLLQDAWDFIALLKHYKLMVPAEFEAAKQVLTLEQIQNLAGPTSQNILSMQKLKPKVMDTLEESRKVIQKSVAQTMADQTLLSISTQAALAEAVVMLHCLPEKLHPVFKPIMESIKKEDNEVLQSLAAEHLAHLVEMAADRTPCPNDKVVTNLCIFLRADSEFTPRLQKGENGLNSESAMESTGNSSRNSTTLLPSSNYNGILTLLNQQKNAERAIYRRSNSTGRGPGRPPIYDLPPEDLFPADEEAYKQSQIMRRGATLALKSITKHFGNALPIKLPKLWDIMVGKLQPKEDSLPLDLSVAVNRDSAAEDLIACLQVLEVTSEAVHEDLRCKVLACLPQLCHLLTHAYRAVRHMAARCIGAMSTLSSVLVMEEVVERVIPFLGAVDRDACRQGAIEAIVCIIERLKSDVIPFVVVLIVPLLGRMSDHDQAVRLCATHSFATLIQLMPLDGGVPDPPNLTNDLAKHKERERRFLEQLFNPKTIEDFKIPVPVNAQLRSYQQSGVNWLAFLNKYKLHGILCDDMGLGKTLQSICMLASDHYNRAMRYKQTGNVDCKPLPSLVVCPPTLTGHWVYEVEKFLSRKYLNPLQYAGPPAERERLRNVFKSFNLIVASYDIVRKDINFFSSIRWNYCILDEGQYIKNGKTKASKAIKQLMANHRLILSGTPIQNNVLELWSLFDFLMPGFLGTEKQFNARYSRPILASREAKSSPKEQEAGVLAMEALHRQVLPFLLRRVKEDVLHDLPPKITQDYYCELSPLQQELYEDFARTQAHQSLAETLANTDAAANTLQAHTHIFQALRYLQKVCNHPRLVLVPSHPEYQRITSILAYQNSDLQDIQNAAKLPALKQLLLDCGIGAAPCNPAPSQAGDISINQHRALIFCQLKVMLDIVEHDLLRKNMPGVSYLRLDGSVPATQRHAVVQRFNKDPSIDVLLLTTQVGGLGLNLTGADTVIFVEHDWNPMKDLQAMDRAHRIGQKKVVNVYRLITRATLEEKIMGLQKFKLLTANTVISSENASMETMGTDQLLDLFSLEGKHKDTNNGRPGCSNSSTTTPGSSVSMKTVLDTLPELWEDKQYEEEYDMNNFIRSLQKS